MTDKEQLIKDSEILKRRVEFTDERRKSLPVCPPMCTVVDRILIEWRQRMDKQGVDKQLATLGSKG